MTRLVVIIPLFFFLNTGNDQYDPEFQYYIDNIVSISGDVYTYIGKAQKYLKKAGKTKKFKNRKDLVYSALKPVHQTQLVSREIQTYAKQAQTVYNNTQMEFIVKLAENIEKHAESTYGFIEKAYRMNNKEQFIEEETRITKYLDEITDFTYELQINAIDFQQ
jgi:hypothetical protein